MSQTQPIPIEISKAYRFCPLCGAKRTKVDPAVRPFQCGNCGHTTFFGPVTAVGCVIVNQQGQVLLIERANDPGRGKLGMPGGFVDAGETAEASLHREVWEEVGLKIENVRYLMSHPNSYVYHGVINPVLDLFFQAQVCESQTICAADCEVSSWMWTDLDDRLLERMAFESNRRALEYFVALAAKQER
jgi:NAD+ diphosphatase